MYLLQLQRSPDNEEAQDQLMKANELEVLQEEAHAAYHQGDYSGTITVLERVIEVCVSSAMELWQLRLAFQALVLSSTSFPDLPLGS